MAVTIEQARAFLARRDDERRRAGELRANSLRARLPAIAELLRARFGATSVRLFGSLARADATAYSDIDIAVQGLEASRYFEALADVMDLAQGPVDLVRLEEAPESLKDRVAAEGETL